jgi:hypothetical protein
MSELTPSKKNRRRCRRRPPKSRVRVTCRRGGLDLGPNLGLTVLDVSEAGIGLLVKEDVEEGREVSIGLEGQSHSRPMVRVGIVVWRKCAADGAFVIGVRFEKALPYTFVLELTREPPPYISSEEETACDAPQMR